MTYNDKAVEKFLEYLDDQGALENSCPSDIDLNQIDIIDCRNQSNCKSCWKQALMAEPEEG
jgi:hypothetical protein